MDNVRTTYLKKNRNSFFENFENFVLDFSSLLGPPVTPLAASGAPLIAYRTPFGSLGSEAPPYDLGEVITFCLDGIRKQVYILFRRG